MRPVMAALAKSLAESVAPVFWKAAFLGAGGYLPDGSAAKLPLISNQLVQSLNGEQFADPRAFALRVACTLKFYNVLSEQIAENFAGVLTAAAQQSRAIMETEDDLLRALPGLYQPQAACWDVPEVSPRDLGVFLSSRMLPEAKAYAQRVWRVDFDALRLNDQALTLFFSPLPDLTAPAAQAAEEGVRREKARRNLADLVTRVNSLALTDAPTETFESLVDDMNEAVRAARVAPLKRNAGEVETTSSRRRLC